MKRYFPEIFINWKYDKILKNIMRFRRIFFTTVCL